MSFSFTSNWFNPVGMVTPYSALVSWACFMVLFVPFLALFVLR